MAARSTGSAAGDTTPVGDLSYSDAGAELDGIIEEFETGVVDVLPRNPSGKILKRELRAPYWEGRERNIG